MLMHVLNDTYKHLYKTLLLWRVIRLFLP